MEVTNKARLDALTPLLLETGLKGCFDYPVMSIDRDKCGRSYRLSQSSRLLFDLDQGILQVLADVLSLI